MKKLFLVLLAIFTSICMLTACGPEAANEKPVIVGQSEVTLKVGERFAAMKYITSATDKEDGDLIENVEVSGSFDTTKAGDYEITYSVTDSKGLTATHKLVLHVEALDEEAPSITGAGNVNAIVGVPFDKALGVKAIDAKDGDLTNKLQISGDVDVQKPGVYVVTYKVADTAGNVKEVKRNVTVGNGAFYFEEANENAVVTFTHDPQSVIAYDIVQVNFTVTDATQDAIITLNGVSIKASCLVAGEEVTTGSVWFKLDANLNEAPITATNATVNSWILGDAADVTAPVMTVGADEVTFISKDSKEAAVGAIVKMCQITAKDDRDGFITANIELDLDSINWDSKDQQNVTLSVKDAAGNEATCQAKIVVTAETELADLMVVDTEKLVKGTAYKGGDQEGLADLYRNGDLEYVESGDDKGALHISNVTSGGYWSFGMIRYILTGTVTPGNYYMLKITARAGLEASEGQTSQGISFRIGQQLAVEPWYYEFKGGSVSGSEFAENRINLSQEYQTFYVVFKAEQRNGDELTGEEPYAMEFHFTPKEWVTVYDTYVKEFSISLLSNEDQKPQLFETSESKLLVVGQEFDPKAYMTASDVEDGDLTSAITVSGTPDLTKAGFFTLTYKVVDSKGHEVTKDVEFEVFTEADTTAPVITFDGDNPITLALDSMTTEEAMIALASKLSVKDTKNGAEYTINLEDCTISSNVDMSAAGKYKVTVTAKDSSGNSSSLEIVVKVAKEEAGQKSNLELVANYMNQATFTQENVVASVNEGVFEIIPTSFEGGYWASFNKSKMELLAKFEEGHKYQFKVVAKADQARDIKLSFASADKGWAVYGSAGALLCDLGTDWKEFMVEFVYDGTFTKNDTVYEIGYTALEIQVGWDSAFTGAQTTSNKVYIKDMSLYEVSPLPTTYEQVADFMTQTFTQENVVAELSDGVLSIIPTTFEGGYWGSFNKSKMELPSGFTPEVGKKYALVVEAKADVARDVKFAITAAGNNWSTYGTVGGGIISLGTKYDTFISEFDYTGKFTKNDNEYNVDYAALELQVGWDSAFSGELTCANKVYIKQIKIYEVGEELPAGYTLVSDYMKQSFTQENVVASVNNGVFEIIPTSFEGGYWASFNKSKMELLSQLEVGKHYAFEVIAKADQARDIKLSFASADKGWAVYGSAGAVVCALGTDWEKFTVEFDYNGKFTKNDNEYEIGYTALEIQVGWDSAFTGAQTTSNKVYIKAMNLYEVEPQWELIGDFLSKSFTQENVTAAINNNIFEITPTSFEGGYWASFNKSKIELLEALEVGKTYKLVVKAKAQEARDIKISLASADKGWAVYGSAGAVTCALGTDWEEFEVEFTYDGTFTKNDTSYEIGYTALEIQVGWDSAFTGAQTTSNMVSIESILLYSK